MEISTVTPAPTACFIPIVAGFASLVVLRKFRRWILKSNVNSVVKFIAMDEDKENEFPEDEYFQFYISVNMRRKLVYDVQGMKMLMRYSTFRKAVTFEMAVPEWKCDTLHDFQCRETDFSFRFRPYGYDRIVHCFTIFTNCNMQDLIPTVVIYSLLSDLNDRLMEYFAPHFPKVHQIYYVEDKWQSLNENIRSMQDSTGIPETLREADAFALIEATFLGTPLDKKLSCERFKCHAWNALSLLSQVIAALAVAECSKAFVHGDLHAGNLMVIEGCTLLQDYSIGNVKFSVEGIDLRACIVNFNKSSIFFDGQQYCKRPNVHTCRNRIVPDVLIDRSFWLDPGNVREYIGNNECGAWKSNLKSNVFWLKHLIEVMLVYLKRNSVQDREGEAIVFLEKWAETVLSCRSVTDFLQDHVLGICPLVLVLRN